MYRFAVLPMQASSVITFPEGSTAITQRPDSIEELPATLQQLGIGSSRPVIVVVGGASGLRHYHVGRLHGLFVQVIAPLAEALGAVVIDGGTDVGVMRMMGSARRLTRSTFPLVGVLPTGVAALPGESGASPDAAALEPNHSHFILVPGSNWGDESPWIAQIASLVAAEMPSVTVLINGGEITWKDAQESIRMQRPIVAIAGSGRAADTLVAALSGNITDERATAIAGSGLLQAVSMESRDGLECAIVNLLEPAPIGAG